MEINKDILLDFMHENHLNMNEAARKIGVDRSHLYRVLNGKDKPGTKFMEGVKGNLGINLDDIFFVENGEHTQQNGDKRI